MHEDFYSNYENLYEMYPDWYYYVDYSGSGWGDYDDDDDDYYYYYYHDDDHHYWIHRMEICEPELRVDDGASFKPYMSPLIFECECKLIYLIAATHFFENYLT